VRDRLSFTRFLGLGIEDGIPDGTTLWLFGETLAKAGLIEKLFERFGQHLEAKGYITRGGQMVDATIVPVPKQRNSRDENADVKAGKTPEAWEKNPAKNRQKDAERQGCASSALGMTYATKSPAKARGAAKISLTPAPFNSSCPLTFRASTTWPCGPKFKL
jgi:IS5 family transposase